MSDRELLELAAKAAGYKVRYVSDGKGGGSFYMEPSQLWWNPLIDDGDALRLAVKLNIHVMLYEGLTTARPLLADFGCDERDYNNPCAATRRSIVRAAAEIGRAMP
jgi:hypothetical protein